MIIEVFTPPFLAAICLIVISFCQESVANVFLGFLPCLLLTYAFGVSPAFLYMIAMELWFYFGCHTICGLLCTVVFSGLLGAVSAYLSVAIAAHIGLLVGSEGFKFLLIGAFIGLSIGFYVGRNEKSEA